MSDAILQVEVESRKKYGIPFYNLMMPCESKEIWEKVREGSWDQKPIIPDYYDNSTFCETRLMQAVLSYNCTEYLGQPYEDGEKQYFLGAVKKSMEDGVDVKELATLLTSFKCANGGELSDFEFELLYDGAKKVFGSKMRDSLEARFLGLFVFDFTLALASMGKWRNINVFLKVFYETLGINPKKIITVKKFKKHIEMLCVLLCYLARKEK